MLPGKGEVSLFFEKYGDFCDETGIPAGEESLEKGAIT